MGLNHNKKRNVGLLREFFSKHIANNIISRNQADIIKAKNIWLKYNDKNTEIQKELKVVSALLETKFDNKEIAYEFMIKLKKYCSTIMENKLEHEKTNLLREINNKINDKDFFSRNIENYVDIATIQLLVSNWIKNKESSVDANNSLLEDKVLNFICVKQDKEKIELTQLFENIEDKNVDGLVIKLMNEKFNNKFTTQLSEEQKYILRTFIFDEKTEILKEKIENIRDVALELIDKETKKTTVIKTDKERLLEIKQLLLNEYYDLEELKDSNIVFYMSISKLNEELKEER